jgi:hypothetical protein
MKDRFAMSRTGEMGYYGAVFKIKKKSPGNTSHPGRSRD